MRAALIGLSRYIAITAHQKHFFFAWLIGKVLPDKALIVIARSDDTTFGILHSRFHELWSLRMGTSLEDRPRYTPTTTFETFPFPEGLTPRDTSPRPLAGEGPGVRELARTTAPSLTLNPTPASGRGTSIAAAAKKLNELREAWLNPPEWVDWVRTPEEEKANFPLRPVAKPGHEAELKKRTLTNLYNARPAWLDNAHKELDGAVAAAYGWADYTPAMPDGEILRRLLALNLERAACGVQ
jgi:type II restriction/modification system DNA methylase subunit YeeA